MLFGEEFQIAAIGVGGVNKVMYASINHDYGREAGRGGVGAVMGSKNLKAIALHGTGSVSVADKDAYVKAGKALYKACKDADNLAEWTRYGTTIVVSWCDEDGALPTRNFQAGSFEGGKTLYGPVMREQIVITDKGCFEMPVPLREIQQRQEVQDRSGRPRIRDHRHARLGLRPLGLSRM